MSDSRPPANCLLYSGIKNLLRCDEAEVVEGIASYVISQHRSLGLLSRFLKYSKRTPIPALLTLLAYARSFLVVRPEGSLKGAAWIARLSNERRAIEPIIALGPNLEWTELKFQSRISVRQALRLTIVNFRSVIRVYKIGRRMHRHLEPFKVMRVNELLGYYARYLEFFAQGSFYLALTSNHSNPHGIAFNLAASKCNVPVMLIAHGMPVRPVARLDYKIAVVHCDAARQTYLEEGCKMNQVLSHGRKQDHRPISSTLPPQIKVGVLLCKDVNEVTLKFLVESLLANERVSRVLIRPHPKNLWVQLDSWIASHADRRLCRSSEPVALDDMKELHVVFGGNSSVLIESVTTGIPSGYVDDLDYSSADLHGFVEAGLIYRSKVDPDFNELLNFYQKPGWQKILRRFANIDDYESSVLTATLKAVHDLRTFQP